MHYTTRITDKQIKDNYLELIKLYTIYSNTIPNKTKNRLNECFFKQVTMSKPLSLPGTK